MWGFSLPSLIWNLAMNQKKSVETTGSINTNVLDALTDHNLYADNDAWYDFERLITN